jgi:hypothetical protein
MIVLPFAERLVLTREMGFPVPIRLTLVVVAQDAELPRLAYGPVGPSPVPFNRQAGERRADWSA